MQQAKAKGGSEMLELLSLRAVAEDVVRMAGVSSESSSIKVVYDFEDVALTLIDRHKVYQILLNLVNNARHAVQDGRPGEGRITLRLRQESGGALKLEVQDTGCGIRSEDMKKIFNYGFTTRREGHGFGLHGSACAALEMGGSLTCHSDGPGLGAVFSLTLPPRPHRLAA
jgi:signal transduction histidine kinase